MARPRKIRKVCDLPTNNLFAPMGLSGENSKMISMTVEHYETIRLIDLEGLTQEECAEQMDVARTTVQRIYMEARKILADFLVNSHQLNIEGGDYRLCKDREHPSGCGRCRRRNQFRDKNFEEEQTMIIGIPVDEKTMDGKVSTNFGRTAFFLLYNMENDEATFIENEAINAQGGAGIKAAQVLVDNQVDVLISPRLGKNAFEVADGAKITVYETNGPSIQENIKALKDGKLSPLNEIHEGFHGNGGH